MSDTYAFLDRDNHLTFAHRKGDSWVVSGSVSQDTVGGRRVTVFVDGLDVATHRVSVPSRSETEFRRAAPFAIEDELAVPVDDVHVAIAGPSEGTGNERLVSAVSHDRLGAWIERLAALGYRNAQLVAAHAVLPEGPILVEAGPLVLGRIGTRAFTLDRSAGGEVFASLLDGESDIQILGEGLAAILSRSASGPGLDNMEQLLPQLCAWAEESGPLPGLRQGSYTPGRQIDMSGFGNWRLAGGLAATLIVGWFAMLFLEIHGLSQRTQDLQERAQSFAQAGWPDSNGDVRSVLSMIHSQRPEETAETAFSPLAMLALLYSALETEDADLKTVRYDRGSERMTVRIGFADFVSVDELSDRLESDGLSVETGDARQSGGQVIGELSLGVSR